MSFWGQMDWSLLAQIILELAFSITPINSGNYSFIVVDANGCSDSMSINFASAIFLHTVSVSTSNTDCDSLADLTINVSQDSGEVDMSTALFESNAEVLLI